MKLLLTQKFRFTSKGFVKTVAKDEDKPPNKMLSIMDKVFF